MGVKMRTAMTPMIRRINTPKMSAIKFTAQGGNPQLVIKPPTHAPNSTQKLRIKSIRVS
jgi:hypothetical protein